MHCQVTEMNDLVETVKLFRPEERGQVQNWRRKEKEYSVNAMEMEE